MLVLGKKIAAPIVRISQVARDVAEGNLDHQIAISGETEISAWREPSTSCSSA